MDPMPLLASLPTGLTSSVSGDTGPNPFELLRVAEGKSLQTVGGRR